MILATFSQQPPPVVMPQPCSTRDCENESTLVTELYWPCAKSRSTTNTRVSPGLTDGVAFPSG